MNKIVSFFTVLFLSMPVALGQQSFEVGDYTAGKEHFEGSVGQKAPFDFDYKYSRSQQIYTAEDLHGLIGKEITEIRFRVSAETSLTTDDYTVALRLYLSNIEDTCFEKDQVGSRYRWIPVDGEKDMVMTRSYTVDFLEITNGDQEYELICTLDKPFLYTGKSMLLTMSSVANRTLGESSASFVDFFCYPRNVQGLPPRTLYMSSDKFDVGTPEYYAEFAGGALKQRAVLKIGFRTATGIENSSYELSNDGTTLVKWLGKEVSIDMQSDAVLSKVTIIGSDAFEDNETLQNIVLPDELQKIESGAFVRCKQLAGMEIPGKVNIVERFAFQECDALASVSLPDGITLVDEATFWKCPALKVVRLPETLEKIGEEAFFKCSALTEIDLPASLKELEMFAFGGCTGLKTVISRSVLPATCAGFVFGSETPVKEITLRVPADALDAYKAAETWGEFGNIEALTPIAPATFAVTLQSNDLGDITIAEAIDASAVPAGTLLTIVAAGKNEHSRLTALTANGVDILAAMKFTVTEATRVEAVFTDYTAAENIRHSELRIYPNPAGESVNLEGALADTPVRIFTLDGRCVQRAITDTDGCVQIRTLDLTPGLYVVEVGPRQIKFMIK